MRLIFGETRPLMPRRNPLLSVYGPGPAGKKCEDCVSLARFQQAHVWYKCEKRLNTKGPMTDHGKTWPACGAFIQRERALDVKKYFHCENIPGGLLYDARNQPNPTDSQGVGKPGVDALD